MLIPFNQLFRRHNVKVDGVLHLGANTGQEAKAYDDLGINMVLWVEALEQLIPQLLENIEPYPDQIALRACLSDEDGKEIVFHVANNGGQSSSFLELGTHAIEHPTVKYVHSVSMKTARFDTLARGLGLDACFRKGTWLLNADLQGAELLAMRGMGDLLPCFRYVYIEVNEKELYVGCPLVGEIDKFLAAFGFVGAERKMTGAGWGDKFYIKQ
jgi:FkbM family methyltransferase